VVVPLVQQKGWIEDRMISFCKWSMHIWSQNVIHLTQTLCRGKAGVAYQIGNLVVHI